MIKLGVNIDHIATIRQARHAIEPEPVFAVQEATLGGADSITIHLREDERHINFRDAQLIKQVIPTKLNLEMSINSEVVEKAFQILPHQVTIVPEKRQELTTESGLNVIKEFNRLKPVIQHFKENGITVSLFVDADPDILRASKELNADFVEIHTGPYANTNNEKEQNAEFQKILDSSLLCQNLNLGFNVGHGLNYHNIFPFLQIPNLYEVNIGHSIISRAVFTGLKKAVEDMKIILNGTV